MRSDASCSILFYLSASEKFAETLGFYNSVVGKPKLLILTGQLRVSIGLKGVLNNGCADFVPDVNWIEQPGNSSRCLIKFQQTTESTKNGVDIATGNRILCGSGEKLRFCRSQEIRCLSRFQNADLQRPAPSYNPYTFQEVRVR